MQFGVAINPADLVKRLVEQVQASAGLPNENVFETLARDEDHVQFPPAERFVTVTPGRFVMVQSHWSGGGRYLPAYDGMFRVACIARFAADQEFRNTRELRDKAKAASALNLLVLDGLLGFKMPTTAALAASYLREPVANIDYDYAPKRIKETSWSVVGSSWSVKFVMELPGSTDDP